MFIGDDYEVFDKAAQLALLVNFDLLEKPLKKIVVYLDPTEFKSTWLGNKSVYRTRMAIATKVSLSSWLRRSKSLARTKKLID